MAGLALLTGLLVCSLCFGNHQSLPILDVDGDAHNVGAGLDGGLSGDGNRFFQVLLDRIEQLERKVDSHPLELQAMQRVYESRLETLRTEYDGKLSKWSNFDDGINTETRRAVRHALARRQDTETNVAFFATLSHDVAHIGQNQNVKFDTVVTNIGNGYDQHQGVFKAPVSGIYEFSAKLVTNYRDTSHFALYLNSQLMSRIWLHGAENGWDGSSNTIVLHMTQGDDVTVQNLDSDKALRGDHYTIFSGFLIAQIEHPSAIIGK